MTKHEYKLSQTEIKNRTNILILIFLVTLIFCIFPVIPIISNEETKQFGMIILTGMIISLSILFLIILVQLKKTKKILSLIILVLNDNEIMIKNGIHQTVIEYKNIKDINFIKNKNIIKMLTHTLNRSFHLKGYNNMDEIYEEIKKHVVVSKF